VVGGKLEVVPRGVMIAGAIMDGARGGVDLPKDDIDRVKSHLCQVLQEDGRHGALGVLTRAIRRVEVDEAGRDREPRPVHPVDIGPADRDRDRAHGLPHRSQ